MFVVAGRLSSGKQYDTTNSIQFRHSTCDLCAEWDGLHVPEAPRIALLTFYAFVRLTPLTA